MIINALKEYKFQIVLFAVSNLILTPLTSSVLGLEMSLVGLINLSILVGASLITAVRRIPRNMVLGIGITTLILVWLEYFMGDNMSLISGRMLCTLLLYTILGYILIRNFLDAPKVNVQVIVGAMSGFMVLGLIGGTMFEILEFTYPGSFVLDNFQGAYDYYYYSFITLVTVGFGDVLPNTAAAKSLTIILSLFGQFYMTIGIALFVGKHLYERSNPT